MSTVYTQSHTHMYMYGNVHVHIHVHVAHLYATCKHSYIRLCTTIHESYMWCQKLNVQPSVLGGLAVSRDGFIGPDMYIHVHASPLTDMNNSYSGTHII